jgi:hypothetical protein
LQSKVSGGILSCLVKKISKKVKMALHFYEIRGVTMIGLEIFEGVNLNWVFLIDYTLALS